MYAHMRLHTTISRPVGLLVLALVLLSTAISACSKGETYAEQKEKERKAINKFLNRDVAIVTNEGDTVIHVGHINVISESQFYRQDSLTDVSKNEYVLFAGTGVYMQIVRPGVGEKLQNGQTKRVISRYLEYNILTDTIQSRSDILYYSTTPDIIDITNNYGTFTASFNIENGGGAMYRIYGSSTVVPSGWLIPFTYIRLGRQINEGDKIAKVRLIVPHSQGQANAKSGVYPCFYEITFQETRN